jgi:peptidoglycan/xylan/chitin deacetylase (PgdA/CDA1 family)
MADLIWLRSRWSFMFFLAGMLLYSCVTQAAIPTEPPFEPLQPSPTPTIEATPPTTPDVSGYVLNPLAPAVTIAEAQATPFQTPTLIPGTAPRLDPNNAYFIEHGERSSPLVALTFDLCQDPAIPSGFDQDIFKALIQANAPATFFLGGDWMRTHVDETRQLASVAYFELGNHSWSHPDFRELEEVEMSREILRTQDLLYQLTGRLSRHFRFPAGQYNTLALSVAAWHGLYSIQWDVVTADPVPDNSAEMIQQRVRSQVQNGSIVIMHANGRGWHTAKALPGMIETLRSEGYCLVTVSQLLGMDQLPDECEI